MVVYRPRGWHPYFQTKYLGCWDLGLNIGRHIAPPSPLRNFLIFSLKMDIFTKYMLIGSGVQVRGVGVKKMSETQV